MRLLLDEHYSPDIAEQLRTRGYDVASVKDRDDLVALSDRELFARMASEGRAIVTEDAAGFMPLANHAAAAGERHSGLIFSSPRSMPRSRATIGLFVARLAELLDRHPADDALEDQYTWLQR